MIRCRLMLCEQVICTTHNGMWKNMRAFGLASVVCCRESNPEEFVSRLSPDKLIPARSLVPSGEKGRSIGRIAFDS